VTRGATASAPTPDQQEFDVLDAPLLLLDVVLGILGFASTWRVWAGVGVAAIPVSAWLFTGNRGAIWWWLSALVIVLGAVAGGVWQSRHERRRRQSVSARR
jgi:hypothetical protein